jgi:murein tripeptide amidase MpaA
MDLFELRTSPKGAEWEQLFRERDEACEKEETYLAEVDKYQQMGDYNTAAMYEYLAGCERTRAMNLTMQIIHLAEELGLE